MCDPQLDSNHNVRIIYRTIKRKYNNLPPQKPSPRTISGIVEEQKHMFTSMDLSQGNKANQQLLNNFLEYEHGGVSKTLDFQPDQP